jgi:hypothetical protein
MTEGWIENSNGNFVWVECGEVRATVYACGDMWGGIWSGAMDGQPRRLKGKFARPEDAQAAVEKADHQGERSELWWPPDSKWLPTKKGGYYRKINGAVVSVKQSKSGSWYAVHMNGALLGQHGSPEWFSTAEEARKAVAALAAGSGTYSWIRRQ